MHMGVSKRNIFTGSVVFMSCCNYSSTSQNVLDPNGPRRASVSPSEAFPPKHLIFRLKAEICSEAANGATEVSRHHVSAERQCDTGATAAVLNSRASAADQIPPQSAARGWLPLFF